MVIDGACAVDRVFCLTSHGAATNTKLLAFLQHLKLAALCLTSKEQMIHTGVLVETDVVGFSFISKKDLPF